MGTALTDILNDLDSLADTERDVSVGDVTDRIGGRGHGAVLLVPGLLGASPLGAIPGVPTLMAVVILLAASQVLIGRERIWLPDAVSRRAVRDDRLARAVERLRGPARWIDRHFGNRLQLLTGLIPRRAAAAICLVFACLLPPLELVPFAALLPLGSVALLGLALTLRDGVLMCMAFAASAAALWGVWVLSPLG